MTQLQGINRLALSRLRPGDALESLRTAFGSKWKTPPRRWDGWVHGHDAGADFSARVDIRNVLGSVSFYGNFPKKYEIEGVSLGADLQDVLHAQPQLEEDRGRNPAFVAYVDETGGGIRRHFSFHRNKLVGIALERSRCEYPRSDVWMPAPDGFYPEPTGEPGAPFADGNLKLVVLDSLLSDKVIDLGTQQDLAMHVLGRYYDPNAEWGFVKEVYDYLLCYPLTPELLAQVKDIHFDGSSEIYFHVWPQCDGEGDEFDVRSIAGIGACPNVETWTEGSMIFATDIAPLGDLRKLREVELCAEYATGFESLIGLEHLERLNCGLDIDPRVRDALEQAGVDIC